MSTQVKGDCNDRKAIAINAYIRDAIKSLGWECQDLKKEVDDHYAELKDTFDDYDESARFLAMQCFEPGDPWKVSFDDIKELEETKPWFSTAVKLQVLCNRLVDTEEEDENEKRQTYEIEPVNIPPTVFEEFDQVRQSGEVNMMDQTRVMSLADAKNYTSLSNFLTNDIGVNTSYEQLLEAFNEWKRNK